MRILLVGGGSGGHVTPLLAVAHELKKRAPEAHISAVTDRNNKFARLFKESSDIESVAKISAGKFRRYPNQSALEKIFDLQTIALNIRDGFRLVVGTTQAISFLGKHKPDIIFIKGGAVGVPVGIAARIKGVPFITHDSDTVPGLTNRIISRWATLHAVGMPARFYAYPKERTVHVGIPTGKNFKTVSEELKKAYRQELHLPRAAKVVFVTGGSQGALRLNEIVGQIVTDLIEKEPQVYLLHQSGGKDSGLPAETDHYRRFNYIDDMYKYTGAADVVISRAGSFLAELAVQGRAAIVVPAPHLAGGHQIENGRHLAEGKAAIVLEEEALLANPKQLELAVIELLKDKSQQRQLAENMKQIYKSGAAATIAELIIKSVK